MKLHGGSNSFFTTYTLLMYRKLRESSPSQRCSEREEECFTLLLGIYNMTCSKYLGGFSQRCSSLQLVFKARTSVLLKEALKLR